MRGTAVLAAMAVSLAFSRDIRVLSWNINKGKRLDHVARTINELKPEIVLLQEVDEHARRTQFRAISRELAESVHMNSLFGPAYEELGQAAREQPAMLGQTILTVLPIRNGRVLQFKRQTGFWKPEPYVPNWPFFQRRVGGRIALVTEFGESATDLAIYNLHLESRGIGGTRLGQLAEVIEDAKRYGPEVTVLVAGDLNSKYRPALYQRKLERAGFRNCFARRIRTHRLYGTLDWLFVRGPGECLDARVLRGRKGSDHDALSATITLPDASRHSATRAIPSEPPSRRQ